MAIKRYKPTTNAHRNRSVLDFAEITTDTPEKTLLSPLFKRGGRNNQGRITMRHQGGGHKRQYRLIDFKRIKDGIRDRNVTGVQMCALPISTSNRFRHMRVNFSARWINPTSMRLKDCHQDRKSVV